MTKQLKTIAEACREIEVLKMEQQMKLFDKQMQ